MHTAVMLKEMQGMIPEESLQYLVVKLREDPLIWAALHQDDFFCNFTQNAGGKLQWWQPAVLALHAIGQYPKFDANYRVSTQIGSDLILKAVKLYEDFLQTPRIPTNLEETGLIAVALLERYKRINNWEGLVNELGFDKLSNARFSYFSWRTSLTVLYGLCEKPEDLIDALLSGEDHEAVTSLIAHIILCNHLKPDELLEQFYCLLNRKSPEIQGDFLKTLSIMGRLELVKDMAKELLNSNGSTSHHLDEIGSTKDLIGFEVVKNKHRAILLRIVGHQNQASTLLQETKKELQDRLLEIDTVLAQSAVLDDSGNIPPDMLGNMTGNRINQEIIETNIFLSISDPEKAGKFIERNLDLNNPFVQIKRAGLMALQGNPDLAHRIAIDAVSGMTEKIVRGFNNNMPDCMYGWQPSDSVRILAGLNLKQEALQCALLFLQIRPSDLQLIDLVIELLTSLEDYKQALNYVQVGLSIDPSNPVRHRLSADGWEKTGLLQNAYESRRKVYELSKDHCLEDRISLIKVALAVNKGEEVRIICQELLATEGNKTEVNGLMGMVLSQIGDVEGSIAYLSKAIQSNTTLSNCWIQLAELFRARGEHQKSLEVLTQAVQVIPENGEINYSLAKGLLDKNEVAGSLEYFKIAANLLPEKEDVSLDYGQTLMKLGKYKEASEIFRIANNKWPENADISLSNAETLTELGSKGQALTILENLLGKNPSRIDWLEKYVEIILGDKLVKFNAQFKADKKYLERAAGYLNTAIERSPGELSLQLMLAEILTAEENYYDAQIRYRTIAENCEYQFPEWTWRIQGGIGFTAFKMKQYEQALAALQESIRLKPDNLGFHQMLAETCIAINLINEAIYYAKNALGLAPSTIENLLWFTDFSCNVGNYEDAESTLNRAGKISPGDLRIMLKQIELEIKKGHLEKAKEKLSTLVNTNNLDLEHYKIAARLAMQMASPLQAIECLQSVVELSPAVDEKNALELTLLFAQMGDLESALNIVNNILETDPNWKIWHLLQSDLLSQRQMISEAMRSLEKYEKQTELSEDKRSLIDEDYGIQVKDNPWLYSIVSSSGYHSRLAGLMREQGKIREAFSHAQSALHINPEDPVIIYFIADLAFASGNREKSYELLTTRPIDQFAASVPGFREIEDINSNAKVLSLALLIKHLFDNHQVVEASQLLNEQLIIRPQNPQLLALQVQLLEYHGDHKIAEEVYLTSKELIKGDGKKDTPGIKDLLIENRLIKASSTHLYTFLIDAAVDLKHWEEAIQFCERWIAEKPGEAAGYFYKAKTLVFQAEWQQLCDEYNIVKHAPGGEVLSDEHFRQFEKSISEADKKSLNQEYRTWYQRGKFVFHPSKENLEELLSVLLTNREAAFVVAALRRTGKPDVGIRLSQEVPATRDVQIEAALCYLDSDPQKGYEMILGVIPETRELPTDFIAAAKLAEKSDRQLEAMHHLESALQLWPDEPEWHAWAARLAESVGAMELKGAHLEQAIQLEQANVSYLEDMGDHCLLMSNPLKAISYLERALQLNDKRTDILKKLSEAYLEAGMLEKSFASAKTAWSIEPDLSSLLACGKASLRMGALDEAHRYLQDAVAQNPEDHNVILFKVHILKQQQHYTEALDLLEKYIALNSVPTSLLTERIKLLWKLDGAESAKVYLDDLASQNHRDIESLGMAAEIHAECGDYAAAEKYAINGLQLDARHAKLNLLMGKIKKKAGQLDQAIHYLSEAIRNEPQNIEAYLELGLTYKERREYSEALKTYQQAMRAVPEDARPYTLAGLIFRENKDFLEAEVMLRQAAILAPDNLQIKRQLGAIVALNLVHNAQEVNV